MEERGGEVFERCREEVEEWGGEVLEGWREDEEAMAEDGPEPRVGERDEWGSEVFERSREDVEAIVEDGFEPRVGERVTRFGTAPWDKVVRQFKEGNNESFFMIRIN